MTVGQNRYQIRRWISTNLPFLRRYKRIFKWRVVIPIRRALISLKAMNSGLHIDPYQIYWISPRIMKYAIYRQIDGVARIQLSAGVTKGGDWDRQTVPVQDLPIIRGARERFIDGKDWTDTDYYRIHLKHINKGEIRRGCINQNDLDNYFRRFDQLYAQIKKNGYKPQTEILDPEFAGTAAVENEIAAHIDRNGRFIFCNGAHRLGIALALGIKKIPVRVCIRHARWQALCIEIKNHAEKKDGKVYKSIYLPQSGKPLKNFLRTKRAKLNEIIFQIKNRS